MPSPSAHVVMLLTPEKSGYSKLCITYEELTFIKLKSMAWPRILLHSIHLPKDSVRNL